MSKSIDDILQQIGHGTLLEELDDKLTRLVAAVRLTGKGGRITMTLSVKPASKTDDGMVFVEPTVAIKEPEPNRGVSLFYTTADNRLVREDPRQLKMELRSVPVEPKDIREANSK